MMFDAAGPGAAILARIGWIILLGFAAIAVGMLILLVVAAVRRSGTLQEHLPHDEGGGYGWLWFGGVLFPLVVLTVTFIIGLRGLTAFPLHDGVVRPPDIRVVGHQWWWEVQYAGKAPLDRFSTANEIHLPVGETMELELESVDVIHSFWVPQLHGKVDLVPGHPNHMRIRADKAGVYRGQCAEFCGLQHAHMIILVVAEPREQFEAWAQHQAQPAATPLLAEAQAGQHLFETRACGLCHAVRGTEARGSVGPDLTHLKARRGIAANSYPNSQAYLAAWSTHAQSLKPGAQMPNLTDFTGEELQALTQYLLALE